MRLLAGQFRSEDRKQNVLTASEGLIRAVSERLTNSNSIPVSGITGSSPHDFAATGTYRPSRPYSA